MFAAVGEGVYSKNISLIFSHASQYSFLLDYLKNHENSGFLTVIDVEG